MAVQDWRIDMKSFRQVTLLLLTAAAVLCAAPARAADPSADEIVKRSLESFYYVGNSMRARVSMKLINRQGQVREREMTLLRLNVGESGNQRFYIYFHGPADVKNTSFLIWKYPAKEDDRWIYVPTLKLVKRIAVDDKRSSFVGSDFTYEDLSGRDLEDETHVLLRKEDLVGRPTYVVENKPTTPLDYSRRLSWIDRERWLPLKEEYFDARNEPLRTYTADKVEQIGEQWAVTVRSMKNLQSGHRTEVVFRETEYGVKIKQDIFTERYLRDAPAQWVR
jgi:outer membrane lipoprotein-sorting protein